MKSLDHNDLEWADTHMEAFVDDELEAGDRRRLEALLEHPAVAARRDEALHLRAALRAIPEPACPDDVAEAILAATTRSADSAHLVPSWEARDGSRNGRSKDKSGDLAGVRAPLAPDRPLWLRRMVIPNRSVTFGRAFAAVAMLLLGAMAMVLLFRPQADERATSGLSTADAAAEPSMSVQESASSEEVARALQDARWALRYVSDLGRSTGRPVRHVVQDRMTVPVRDAVSHVLHDRSVPQADPENQKPQK